MSNHIPSLRMSSGLLAVVVAGSLLCGSAALAADLDPGYADVPAAIPQQNVMFGSGWYIRGDVAGTDLPEAEYNAGGASNLTWNNGKRFGYAVSGGGGYAFTNWFRLDAVFDYHQPVTSRYQANIESYDVLANGYLDLGHWWVATPYIGAGVGVGFGSFTSQGAATSPEYYNLAFALMGGVAFDVADHVKVDVGYRYLNLGKVLGKTLNSNEARVGFRYMIDN